MKVLHTGDTHFREKELGESLRCFEFIIERARGEGIDLVIHAGDLFDRNMMVDSPAYHEAIKATLKLAGVAPIVMVRGNHDPERSLDIFYELKTVYPVYLFQEIGTFPIEVNGETVTIAALPYRKKSDFDLPAGLSVEEQNRFVAGEMGRMVHCQLPISNSQLPIKKLLVGHVTVAGSELANKQTVSQGEPALGIEDLLAMGCEGYFLGHIHQHEQGIFQNTPIRYCGPHYRTNFGETQQLGFWLWEDGNWERVNTPARRAVNLRMSEAETRQYLESGEIPGHIRAYTEDPGVDCKIKIDVPQALARQVDETKIAELTGAAVEKRVLPGTAARGDNIQEMGSLREKFCVWAEKNGVVAEAGLLAMVEGLEG